MGDDPYAAVFWQLEAEAARVFLELAPQLEGVAVPLGDMQEACARLGRPVRDAGELQRLLAALDTRNEMRVTREDLVMWLLADMWSERALMDERLGVCETESQERPPALPQWEEIVELGAAPGVGMQAGAATYFYNTLTGEASWELPRLVQTLRAYLGAQATKRALKLALPEDGTPAFLLADEGDRQQQDPTDLEVLRELFDRCDDDASGVLDPAEFQDLCMAIGQPVNGVEGGVAGIMSEVDPYGRQQGVAWEALSRYWVSNSPIQRRSRLEPPGETLEAWELVEPIHKCDAPSVYRHTVTLRERWNHPHMEQRIGNMLTTLFPSSKLDWDKKIELYLDVQWQQQLRHSRQDQESEQKSGPERKWSLRTCWRVLIQLQHPMTRRSHLGAAIQNLRDRFGFYQDADDQTMYLSEEIVRRWFQYSVQKVDQNGWEQLIDEASGQVYYYHEINGTTQWDPPNLAAQMAGMLGLNSSPSLGASTSPGKKMTPSERVERLFRQYDTDESGAITLDEFRPFYRALVGRGANTGSSVSLENKDNAVSESQLQHLFSVLDTSGDGEVTFEEFQLWWRTKLELEEDETEAIKLEKKRIHQRQLCISYLENSNSAILVAGESTDAEAQSEPRIVFESNLLPRLVGLLGPFQLKGLAHRSALTELVEGFTQQVELDSFLQWYESFEAAELERQAIEEAKARAKAELAAQQQRELAAAKEKRRKMKQRRQIMAPITLDEASAREQKITALFKTFDANGSGFLDESELRLLAKALGHDMNNKQLKGMMRAIDVSGDGQVSLSEFISFWNAFQPVHGATKGSPISKQAGIIGNTAVVNDSSSSQKHRTSATFTEMNASLEIALELAKDRALKVSLNDFTDYLGDWKAEFALRGKNRRDAIARLEQEKEEGRRVEALRRQRWAFKPTGPRKYGAYRLDVSSIEPEVVTCVSDMICTLRSYLLFAPDAAQTIQRFARGYVARVRMFELIKHRFDVLIDLPTKFYYYIDKDTLKMHVERPLFRRRMASVKPYDLEDCASKVETHHFHKKINELQRKAAFYERNFRSAAHKLSSSSGYRPQFAPSAMILFDIAECVHKRLLSNIWLALRDADSVLVELIAQRYRRQLCQRSSDSAKNLPLHYLVRNGDLFPLSTLRAVVCGYPDALTERDAFGMTPLHLALRESRRLRRGLLDLLMLLVPPKGKIPVKRGSDPAQSIWEMKTVCGDTPLHTAIRHHAGIPAVRWLLRRISETLPQRVVDVISLHNKRGESAFHLSVSQLIVSNNHAYSKTIVLQFLRYFQPHELCMRPTRQRQLPLHIALNSVEELTLTRVVALGGIQDQIGTNSLGAIPAISWLTRELILHYPGALLARNPANELLPVHLAIKRGLPVSVLRDVVDKQIELLGKLTLQQTTTIEATNTTLIHYLLIHQPHEITFIMELLDRMPESCSIQTHPGKDLPLHLAAGLHTKISSQDDSWSDAVAVLIEQLCKQYPKGCETYNAAQELPIHVAISRGNSARTVKILLEHSASALGDENERRGLRALVLAASARIPDYRVILALLDVAPSRPLGVRPTKSNQFCGWMNTPVTPLYALSLRQCTPEVIEHGIPGTLHDKFERIEDEDAYFLAMAKSKLRQKHHNPNEKWSFEKILTLMEHNPLDEAVMQRALLAINSKLASILKLENKRTDNQGDPARAYGVILDTITLNPELKLVRTVHHTMYEFPLNPRVQILGKSVLDKLLPTAYAKATYKSKIDPYFNL